MINGQAAEKLHGSSLPLYLRWIGANALGELLGLGATFAIGIGLFSGLADSPHLLPVLLTAVLMAASGIIEGSIVGWLQWNVLRHPLPQITRRSWILATIYGAVIAWGLGAIPMTIASLNSPADAAAMQEPDPGFMLLMEVLMGLAAGLILAFVQWRVLRRAVHKAWVWLPANSLAWGVGMPLIFSAVDQAQASSSLAGAVVIFALHLLLTGALAGAIHGLALIWLSRNKII
jgi:hypothetical protein